MKIREITKHEAIRLCAADESHFFEKKSRDVKSAKVEQLAVAFANADGGEFLIGVMDCRQEPDVAKRWAGVASIEDLNSHLQVLFNVQPNLDLRYEILTCAELNGYVLRVNIEKTSEVHHTSDGSVYQRYGAQSLRLKDPERIMELSYSKGSTSFEDQPLPDASPEMIVESEILGSFLSEYSPKTDPLEFCVNQNLFTYKEWTPRVCSVLIFSAAPASFVPKKCSVKISRYETKEEEAEREHLSIQETIDSPLYDLIHQTVARVSEIISSVKVVAPGGRNSKCGP